MILSFYGILLSSLLILTLTRFACYGDAQPLYLNCSQTDTYTTGSTYESNLFKLLSSLSTEALVNSAFSNQSFGSSPNEAYGLVMCYNDHSVSDCFNCLRNVTSNATQPCSNKSATATVFYAACLLSYSSKDFLGTADLSPAPICLYSGANTYDTERQISLTVELGDLSATTPNTSGMFSSMVVDPWNITAFMQCTRDLSPAECKKCLSNAMTSFARCSINGTAQGMRIMTRNCYVRYEQYAIEISSFPQTLVSPAAGSKSKSKRTITISIVVVVVSVVASLAAIGFCFWRRRRSLHKDGDEDDDIMALQENVETELQYILNPNAEYQVYNFTTLKVATESFSDMNKLGKGGFGPVYKGILPGGQEIAVKRLSGSSAQGITEFKNEVEFLAKLKHKNLVQLLGCCIQNKEKLLCYEYLPNGSLDKILFAKDASAKVILDWKMRHRIIEGITRGLHYLHEESRLKIIHRDLKVSNILLDKDMNAKISDFGLARFFEEDQTQKDTNIIAGTFGYMAPEYILRGNFSAKSDVYSFGILLLEIVTGQKNSSFVGSDHASSLIDHAFMHCKDDKISELKDPMLDDEFHKEIRRCVHIALLCVQEDPIDRPNMETVKNMLASPSMSIPNLPYTLSLARRINNHRRESSMTTDTSTLRSRTESFTSNSIYSTESQTQSSGTRSSTK